MKALALLLGLTLGSATALAETNPDLDVEARGSAREQNAENPLRSLLPSADVLHARARQRLEEQMARSLLALAHTRRAEVVLTLPELSRLPLDRPAPPARANVWLEVLESGPSDADVIVMLRAALPELPAERIHVVRSRLRPAPARARSAELVRVGPFVVARESSALLRACLAACLSANALLAALVLARARAR